jgi:hypothetical protein
LTNTKELKDNNFRGYCKECGSSLFRDRRENKQIIIAAGSIDPPTGLATERHVWLSQKTDYYTITDGLPCREKRFVLAGSGGK